METTIDNPIKRVDSEALDNAYKVILESLKEVARKNELSDEEINYLSDLIRESYLRRKSTLFVRSYSDELSNYLKHAFRFALNQESDESQISDYTKLFYYKSKKHSIASDK
ncbi:hypothetical protein [Marinoscillum furvescens]|uniref:Uncharacterized protein n=1 Tax=Marinoscillum furvescens DSM 4134 TaxID=1122208 RepID=A0A3D9KX45_MARFU|nr:hypothetical protein [Marinoscillum furvescens]RED93168.1 hypothetical protein C7460_1267 [Marinoscillum furvescens DSM 4134]